MHSLYRNYLFLLGLFQLIGGAYVVLMMWDEILGPLGIAYGVFGLLSFGMPWLPSKAVTHYVLLINAALLGFGVVFIPILTLIGTKGLGMSMAILPAACALLSFGFSYKAHRLSRRLESAT